MLDLRLLRYFVAVAETEHVGRAAERLHISQSPLSRQIMQLEDQLGVMLFERSRQRIRLTPEGLDFLAEARLLLAHAQRIETFGRHLGAGAAGRLAIGYVEGAMHAPLLSAALRRFRRGRPAIALSLQGLRSGAQVERLRDRSLDLGFVYTPPAPDDPDIDGALVLDEPVLLALPANDPLCRRKAIRPEHLDQRPWITVVRQPGDTNRPAFLAACAQAGFTPDVMYETSDPLSSLGLVAAGLGLAVAQASLRSAAPPEVVFRELPWFDRRVRVYMLWRRADPRPLVAAFRAAVGGGEGGSSGAS